MTSVRPDPGLSRIAEDTGGGYFELTRAEDLGSEPAIFGLKTGRPRSRPGRAVDPARVSGQDGAGRDEAEPGR